MQGPGDDLVELDGLPHEGEYARPKAIEVQDPSDQAEQTVDAVVDRLDPLALPGIQDIPRPQQNKLGRGADGRERIPEFMRDLGEELLLELFDFSQLESHAIEGPSQVPDLVP